jgi:Restriction endonuclease
MASGDDEEIPFPLARYPVADVSAAEFEQFVAELCGSAGRGLEDFRVTLHDVIEGTDGTYDFDATVRFRGVLGMEFLVVVESKRHSNPIKRDVVQVLHQKQLSVGAHKAVVISTAKFQSGAIKLAKVHGIALATVIEDRLRYEWRSVTPVPTMTREQAAERGLPVLAGMYVEPGQTRDSWQTRFLELDDPERLREFLLELPDESVRP